MKENNKNKYFFKKLFLIMFFLSIFIPRQPIRADELDDLLDETCKNLSEKECEDLRADADLKESEFDSLDNQLKNAEKLLKLKKQQSQTLAGQVEILNTEIKDVQGDIYSLENEILNTQSKIETLKNKIKSKEDNIKDNQNNLGEMIRSYYRLSQDLGLSFLSKGGSLTKIFNQSDSLGQLSTKVNNILRIIREEKANLGKEREIHELEKGKLNLQKKELDKERQALSTKKNEKGNLLARTKGEEAGYQALIGKIESQMKQLLIDVDSLSVAEQGELDDILKNADEPKEGKASTSWYYSQRDSDWANDEIAGIDGLTMAKYGCAISSVAMVLKYYDENVEPDDIAKKTSAFASDGSIKWSYPTTKYDVVLDSSTGHGNIDWDEVEDSINHQRPVIIFIKGSSSGSGHYVVIHGYDSKNKDFVVHDPYWGSNLLLGTSKKLVSNIYKRTATIDQMIIYKPD